jgi:hypothetical protein
MQPRTWAALALGLAIAGSANAQSAEAPTNLGRMTLGYTYFNRPGADTKAHDDAVMGCAAQAAKTHSYDEQSPPSATGLAPALISGVLQSAYHHGAVGANLENCMVVRGWRVVLVADAEGKNLASLPQRELAARLAPWVGAQTPHGDVVRSWRNDAGLSGTVRFSFRPPHINDGQLSLLSATGHDLTQFATQPDPFASLAGETYAKALDKRWLGAMLKPTALASAAPEGGVVIAEVRGGSIYGSGYVVLRREGSTPDDIASVSDHRLDFAIVGATPSLFANRKATMVAQAVPPGRWHIWAIGSTTHGTLNFCLGAPSFEVKPGDLIYLGSFDFLGDLGPNMGLAPVRAWLADTVEAGKVKAAEYTNGSTGPCGGVGIYAFEIPGAPFEPNSARH